MHLIEHNLLQEVQPDIMGRRAFAEPRIVVVAAKEFDVVVALVKVESQIAAALRAIQIAAKGVGLLCYGRPSAPGSLQIKSNNQSGSEGDSGLVYPSRTKS